MADGELEDGEVLDSDSDDGFISQRGITKIAAPPTAILASSGSLRPLQTATDPNLYRDKAAGGSSSNSDDDSDEERFLWKRKRLKYTAYKEKEKLMDCNVGGPRVGRVNTIWNSNPLTAKNDNMINRSVVGKPKKKKDIWGPVLQEQMLSQGFVGFDMEHKEASYNDRNVEAYAFKKALEDNRPWPVVESDMGEIKNTDPFDSAPDLEKLEEDFVGAKKKALKRKLHVKERLGPREYNKLKCRNHFKATATDKSENVVIAVAEILKESKVELVERVVCAVGRGKTLELTYLTEDIEERGGMMTNNGSRRRTPGGVFFQLLKSDPEVTKKHLKYIFQEETKREIKRKKLLRSKRFRNTMKKKTDSTVTADGDNTMELGTNDSKEEAPDSPDTNENDNSRESSRGSSYVSDAPDPAKLDLSELLKQHIESREEERKKTKSPLSEAITDSPHRCSSSESLNKQEPDILEADIYLDDEADMTLDI